MNEVIVRPYPWIDPVFLDFGFFEIRWYSLAYIAGFFISYFLILFLNKKKHSSLLLTRQSLDSLLTYAVVSVIIGGRIGYVLFYNLPFYLSYPSQILMVWNGGMSFHGGLIGVIIGVIAFCRLKKVETFKLFDLMAVCAPIGLFFGRIANFINGELWGRVILDQSLSEKIGVVFPQSGDLFFRHPSQLYEAALEGFVLFVILFCLANFTKILQKQGVISGMFLLLYGVFRFFIEYFREPDSNLGYFFNSFSMGQILCICMVFTGITIISVCLFKGVKTPYNNIKKTL